MTEELFTARKIYENASQSEISTKNFTQMVSSVKRHLLFQARTPTTLQTVSTEKSKKNYENKKTNCNRQKKQINLRRLDKTDKFLLFAEELQKRPPRFLDQTDVRTDLEFLPKHPHLAKALYNNVY